MGKIQDLVRETYNLKHNMEVMKVAYETNRLIIQKYFDSKGIGQLEIEGYTDGAPLVVSKQERMTVDYFTDKLKEKLNKEVYNEIVNKTYTINNIEALVSLLKEAGIKPQQFKELLSVSEVLNKEQLKQLYAVGDISAEDLKGCYNAHIVKSIQIKERKGGKE